jgi:hypothetical protein
VQYAGFSLTSPYLPWFSLSLPTSGNSCTMWPFPSLHPLLLLELDKPVPRKSGHGHLLSFWEPASAEHLPNCVLVGLISKFLFRRLHTCWNADGCWHRRHRA